MVYFQKQSNQKKKPKKKKWWWREGRGFFCYLCWWCDESSNSICFSSLCLLHVLGVTWLFPPLFFCCCCCWSWRKKNKKKTWSTPSGVEPWYASLDFSSYFFCHSLAPSRWPLKHKLRRGCPITLRKTVKNTCRELWAQMIIMRCLQQQRVKVQRISPHHSYQHQSPVLLLLLQAFLQITIFCHHHYLPLEFVSLLQYS